MKLLRACLFLAAALVPGLTPPSARAEGLPGRYSVGVLGSGLMLERALGARLSLGAQFQRQSGVSVFGLRERWFSSARDRRTLYYLALEQNLVRFNIEDVHGDGWTFGTFLGVERRLSRRWSASFDAGPVHLSVEHDGGEVANRGLHFVANAGIAWHWGDR